MGKDSQSPAEGRAQRRSTLLPLSPWRSLLPPVPLAPPPLPAQRRGRPQQSGSASLEQRGRWHISAGRGAPQRLCPTNDTDGASVSEVVCHNLAHLGEVPAVPLTTAHVVVVELLVEVVKEGWRGEAGPEARQGWGGRDEGPT